MNPQLPHRKNTLLDNSAATVKAVWSHQGNTGGSHRQAGGDSDSSGSDPVVS
jgi:hypothetical protein